MDNNINLSEEMQEVADPVDVESEEMQEAADPVEPQDADLNEEIQEEGTEPTEKTSDSAFAEMRRERQALERENKQLVEALGLYFNGETADDLSIAAQAYARANEQGGDPAEWQEQILAERRVQELEHENETLLQQVTEIRVNTLMNEALNEIQSIDPNVQTLDELGEDFISMVAAGLDTKRAYYASRQMVSDQKVNAPKPIGAVSAPSAERDYYTSEELDNLSDAEMDSNWEKVMRSMGKLGKTRG